jgi:hypothetical protein
MFASRAMAHVASNGGNDELVACAVIMVAFYVEEWLGWQVTNSLTLQVWRVAHDKKDGTKDREIGFST